MQGFRILFICCRAVSGDASIAASSLACNARTCLLDAIFVMPAPVFHTLRTATTTFAPGVLEIFRNYLPIGPQVVPFWDYLNVNHKKELLRGLWVVAQKALPSPATTISTSLPDFDLLSMGGTISGASLSKLLHAVERDLLVAPKAGS